MSHHKIFCFCFTLSLFFHTKAQEEFDLVFQGSASVGSSWQYINQNSQYIFFGTRSSANDRELWRSDGTQAGTLIVKDIHPSSNGIPSNTTNVIVGEILYFAANGGLETGQELWKSDGTEEGTVLIKDIYPGIDFGIDTEYMVEFDGGVAFTAQDANGEELWKSDGAEAGTVLIKDINLGSGNSFVRYIANADGTLYFIARESTEYGLWKSDGTDAGTVKLGNLGADASPEHVTFHQGNILFYSFTTSDTSNDEIWISDGTVEGTEVLTNISTSGPINDPMVASGDNLFFRAANDAEGIELYKTDGTVEGTGLVKDLKEGAGDGFPENFIEYLDEIYFVADSKLWKSDGTEEGTVIVVQEVSNRTEILSDGSNLYYRVNGNLGIYNPADGVSMITTTPDFYVHDLMTIFNDELYFIGGDDVEEERELWKYNPSPKMDQDITFGELSDVTFGDDDFTLSATNSSNLTVTFESTDEDVVEVNGTIVSIIGAGTCDIIASQIGDDEYNPAANVTQSLTVNKAPQDITFGALSVKELTSSPFTLSASSNSGLDVSYASSNLSVASVTTAGVVTIVGVGTTTITASQEGNTNYLAADDIDQTLTVVDALGIGQDTNILIYPNPVSEQLRVELLRDITEGTIELLDSSGKLIHSQQISSSELSIDMSQMEAGIYYLRHKESGRAYKVSKVHE